MDHATWQLMVASLLSSLPAGSSLLASAHTVSGDPLEKNLREQHYTSLHSFLKDWHAICYQGIHAHNPSESIYWEIDHTYFFLKQSLLTEASRKGELLTEDASISDASSPSVLPENSLYPQFKSHALMMLGPTGPLFTSPAHLSRLDSRLPDGGIVAKPVAVMASPAYGAANDVSLSKVSAPSSSAKASNPVINVHPSSLQYPTQKPLFVDSFSSFSPIRNTSASVISDDTFKTVSTYYQSERYQKLLDSPSIDVDFIEDNLDVVEEDVLSDVPLRHDMLHVYTLLQRLQNLQNTRISSPASSDAPSLEERSTASEVGLLLSKLILTYNLSPSDLSIPDIRSPFTKFGPQIQGSLPPTAQPFETTAQVQNRTGQMAAGGLMNGTYGQYPSDAPLQSYRRSKSRR
ncbi:RSC complex subunit Rsc58 [Schizosaccharomyces cryophilus OY26]|uniref:RSC complex subunit Rsc58 n=1 Tax=Schizosaccharomyces cryophilus (strain OY26 / ATCC MYA-4695 / CBS 11777 / NBRC 106824 / NRRL Y48691) TaxID=653667 RepID=S9W2C2_SCHCR|nr:RSC complex subunit Rsc58 [Schizosaccharomyces cryophilus OY26]EPY54183.1 RSC complex subunit Rsc58 [Schizosaccharomyces cryophilus OY26]